MFTISRWDMRLTDREVLKAINRLQKPLNIVSLAEILDCSERTVRRSIKRMEERKILTHIRGGHRVPSEYQVNLELVPEDVRSELA